LIGFGILLCAVIITIGFLFQRTGYLEKTQNILFVPSSVEGGKNVILLAHLSPGNSKVEMAVFPPDLPVNTLGGYGSYPLQSLFPLLALDDKSPAFMRAAYSHALQLPIDEVISFHPQMVPTPDTIWWQLLTYKMAGQMNFIERLRAYRFVQNNGPSELEKLQITDEKNWQKMSSKFRLPAVNSDCGVAVLNTTNVAGTGSIVTTVLENSGVPVIRLSDTPDQLSQTKILVNQALPFCQEVVTHLGNLFPFETRVELDPKTMNTYRAQIVILIGQDFAQEVAKKP
jgi:hypothetical protein